MKHQIFKDFIENLQYKADKIYCRLTNKSHVLECDHKTYTKYVVKRLSNRTLKSRYPNFVKERVNKLIVIDTENNQILYPSKESPKRDGYVLLYDTRDDTVRIATAVTPGFAGMPGIYDKGETFYHEELCTLIQ